MAARKRPSPRTTKPVPARRAPTPRGVGQSKKSARDRKESGLDAPPSVNPIEYARERIRDIPDFPEPGILFRDITPLLADPRAFHITLDSMAERFIGEHVDAVVAVESRGFIFGAALAARLNASFVPVRKPGKLPGPTDSVRYSLEYGEGELQIHKDALKKGAQVVIVDDLLATGGTARAAGTLVRKQGGQIKAYAFVVELLGLGGRAKLRPVPVVSLITYA